MLLFFNCSVMSNSLRPYRLQHTRLPCSSPSLRVCPSSCPLNWWCHPTISSSVIPFSSCLQSYSVSESFPVIQLLASGGQSTGASASASVLPMNIQGWFPFDWFDHFIVQKTQHTFIDRQIHRSVSAIDLKYFQWCITFYFKGRVITMCQVLSLSV